MKKSLLGLMLSAMFVVPISGCNKDKVEGVYKFDSFKFIEENNSVYYSCSETNKNNSSVISASCESIGDGRVQWELKDNGKAVYSPLDEEGNVLNEMYSVEVDYIIEDGKFKTKGENSDTYTVYGSYEDGVLYISGGLAEDVEMVFKKK